MSCQRCNSERVIYVQSHGRDLHVWEINGVERDGYLPSEFNIGGGDDLEINLCLECGQVQGKWPLPLTSFEKE